MFLKQVVGTGLIALAASTLPLVVAQPAHAAAPVEKAFVLADTNGDGRAGVYLRTMPPSGVGTAIVPENASTYVFHLSTSRDGTRAIFRVDSYEASAWRQKIEVADVGGQIVRVLENIAYDGTNYLHVPQLSPDGNIAVWEIHNRTTGTRITRRANVSSGTATTIASDFSPYAILNGSTLLGQDGVGNPFTMPLAGGARTAVTGLPVDAMDVTVSPDGSHVAWGLFDSTVPDGAAFTATMQVARLTLVGSTATTDQVVTIASGLNNVEPTFSRDGTTVYFIRNDGASGTSQGIDGPGDLWSAPADASAAATQLATTADETDVAIAVTDDGTSPGAAGPLPVVLRGTSATLNWTLPADLDLSGTLITCTHGGVTQRTAFVPAPISTYVDTGLQLNFDYTCTFTPKDRSGNAGTFARRDFFALQALAAFADPTSTTSAKASFPVSFAPVHTPNGAVFKVDYLTAGTATWHPWVTDAQGRVRTFGSPASTGVNATTSTPGTNYVFRVQVRDYYGNTSPFISSPRAVVPFDQTKATLSGGTNISATAAYLGSYRRLSKTTDYAKVTLVGNRMQIVGVRCSTCGSFNVFEGGVRIATISSYSSSSAATYRAVLYTRSYSSVGTHTWIIRPAATSGRPYVILDGFAARH